MPYAHRQAAPTLWDERLTLRAPRISDRQDRLAIGKHAECCLSQWRQHPNARPTYNA